MRSLSVSPWLLLPSLVLLEPQGPTTRSEAVESVFPVPSFSDPVRSSTTSDPTITDDGFYVVDSVSTDFDSAFPIPSHMSHSLSVKDEDDARERVAHDPFYPYMQKRVSLTPTARVNYKVPAHSVRASSLPELSVTSLTPDVAAETNLDFMLQPQAVDPYTSHSGTVLPSSVDAAPSPVPDFSPLPSVPSLSQAPKVASPTIAKKVLRGTTPSSTTTSTRSTTSRTSTKRTSFSETDDASNVTTDSRITMTGTSSSSLLIRKYTTSTSTATTTTSGTRAATTTTSTASTTSSSSATTASTASTPTNSGPTTTASTTPTPSSNPASPAPPSARSQQGDPQLPGIPEAKTVSSTTTTTPSSKGRRRVCALFQFLFNQILKTLSRCQDSVGDDSEKEQTQVKSGASTEGNEKIEERQEEMDFILDSLTDQFFLWAESLLQWLAALGRTMQSNTDSLQDVFLKIPTERIS